MRAVLASAACAVLLASCQQSGGEEPAATPTDEAQIELGNGEFNVIEIDGLARDGNSLIVPSVTVADASFVVMHPFRDGAPVRDEYVAATLVDAGTSEGVSVAVEGGFVEGDQFIIMLHRDVNEDGVFDFGDGQTVPDAPVFEGATMIAHSIAAPGVGD